MATFIVQVDELIKHTVEVEAESADEARDKGYEIILNGPDTEYNSDSEGTHAIYVYEA